MKPPSQVAWIRPCIDPPINKWGSIWTLRRRKKWFPSSSSSSLPQIQPNGEDQIKRKGWTTIYLTCKWRQFSPDCPGFEFWICRILPLVWAFFPSARGLLSHLCVPSSHLCRLSSCVYAGSLLGSRPLGWVTKKMKRKGLLSISS